MLENKLSVVDSSTQEDDKELVLSPAGLKDLEEKTLALFDRLYLLDLE